MNPKALVFTEKYRPSTVKDVMGNAKITILNYMKNPQTICNFLFASKCPGTGKTTMAKAIIKDIGCDYIILNSSDDRKIETVRDKIKEFALTKSSNGLRKCIFLDEADGMLKVSQEALRNIMETYASNVFFILTCNNIEHIIDPIRSRCTVVDFTATKDDIKKYLMDICIKEKLEFTDDGLSKLIDINYPNIRNCVITLQDLFTQGKKVVQENISTPNDMFEVVWKLFEEKKFPEIKNMIFEQGMDVYDINKYFWNRTINDKEPNIKLIQVCCRNERDFAYGSDKNIIFLTGLLEMMKQ